jgi:hypothetical protein
VTATAAPARIAPSAILASRALAAATVLLALVALSPMQMLLVTIVGGQGHFLAGYYYQAKAGKIGWRYGVLWLLALVVLVTLLLLYPDPLLIPRVASVYFVIHLLHDEMFLFGERPSPARGLEILPVLLVYAGFLADLRVEVVTLAGQVPYPTVTYPGALGSALTRTLVAAGALALLANLGLVAAGRRPPRGRTLYFQLAAAVLLGVYAWGGPIRLEYLMGSPILFHYVGWYAHYYLKYRPDPPRRALYVRDILLVNAVVLLLYLSTGRHPEAPFPVGPLFLPGFFYVWTILHIAFTTRRSDAGFWRVGPLSPAGVR